MDHLVETLQRILLRSCTNIPILVPITLQDTILARHQHVASHIEFSFVIQERIIDILLNDIGFKFAVRVHLTRLDDLCDLIQVGAD